MKQCIKMCVIAVAVLLTQLARAQTITDNFTDASAWGSMLFEAGGSMSIGAGRMTYTTSTTNNSFAAMPRNLPLLSVTNDWSLKVDAHLNAFAIVDEDQWCDLFLGFGKANGLVNDHVTFAYGRGFWAEGYKIEDAMRIGGNDAPELFTVRGFTSADVSLRLDYSAANQFLTYYFDSDGAAYGHNWQAEGSVCLSNGLHNMNLSATDTFTLFLGASSENQTVDFGQAYFTNLRITINAAPAVDTGAVGNITNASAVLTGIVNPNGWSTTAWFEYGLTTAYGEHVQVPFSPSNGVVAQTVSAALTGLRSGTTYHYRIVAFSDGGTSIGNDATFTSAIYSPVTDFATATNSGAIIITGYSGFGGNIVIPAIINGCPVTAIGNSAFWGCKTLTSVVIPEGVTTIGHVAFSYCRNMTAVAIPSSVTSVEWLAFAGCSSLSSATIPGSVTSIGPYAFMDCTSLTSFNVDPANAAYCSIGGVLFNKNPFTLIAYPGGLKGSYNIPGGVTSIEQAGFAGCANLTSVTIPNSVANIGDDAFLSCSGLTSVTIPNHVGNIGYRAFEECSGLTIVTMGSGVSTIGAYAFRNCFALTNIVVAIDSPHYASTSGVLFNKSMTTLVQYPGGLAGHYSIPNSVTSVGLTAFSGCSRLTSVTIGDGVTSIGDFAFDGCDGLTNVVIGNSVTSIGDDAFQWCIKLTSVAIPNSVTNIGGYAFNNCTSLTNVTMGNRVITIGSSAFYYCSSLRSVLIPSSVNSIGDSAFAFCTNLTQAYFSGNAPLVNGGAGSADSTVFYRALGMVYYIPGTTGWADTFGGWPIAPWYRPNPTLLSDSSLGIQSNDFGFTVSWATNTTVVVEAKSSLASVGWTPVLTNGITNGTFYFFDPNWKNYAERFYRVRTP